MRSLSPAAGGRQPLGAGNKSRSSSSSSSSTSSGNDSNNHHPTSIGGEDDDDEGDSDNDNENDRGQENGRVTRPRRGDGRRAMGRNGTNLHGAATAAAAAGEASQPDQDAAKERGGGDGGDGGGGNDNSTSTTGGRESQVAHAQPSGPCAFQEDCATALPTTPASAARGVTGPEHQPDLQCHLRLVDDAIYYVRSLKESRELGVHHGELVELQMRLAVLTQPVNAQSTPPQQTLRHLGPYFTALTLTPGDTRDVFKRAAHLGQKLSCSSSGRCVQVKHDTGDEQSHPPIQSCIVLLHHEEDPKELQELENFMANSKTWKRLDFQGGEVILQPREMRAVLDVVETVAAVVNEVLFLPVVDAQGTPSLGLAIFSLVVFLASHVSQELRAELTTKTRTAGSNWEWVVAAMVDREVTWVGKYGSMQQVEYVWRNAAEAYLSASPYCTSRGEDIFMLLRHWATVKGLHPLSTIVDISTGLSTQGFMQRLGGQPGEGVLCLAIFPMKASAPAPDMVRLADYLGSGGLQLQEGAYEYPRRVGGVPGPIQPVVVRRGSTDGDGGGLGGGGDGEGSLERVFLQQGGTLVSGGCCGLFDATPWCL